MSSGQSPRQPSKQTSGNQSADPVPATHYVGRFAPSPSGPLHMGSLLAAVASFLDARAHQGRWLVRIEDLDPPREQPGADRLILDTLVAHGLHWDGSVIYQSQRHAAYEAVIAQLQTRNLLFYCRCSRRILRAHPGVYPGTCRAYTLPRSDSAIRCRIDGTDTQFDDLIQGPQQLPPSSLDDFIIRRRDGLYAYQLAVVVDDHYQGITHVIRGNDLLDSTPRQRHLFALLDQPCPAYGHIPVIINADGQKLSKQHHAPALSNEHAPANLMRVLHYLGLAPPEELSTAPVDSLLDWAIPRWDRATLRGQTELSAPLSKGDKTPVASP